VPPSPKPRYYILKPGSSLPEVWDKFVAGAAVVKDYFVVENDNTEASLVSNPLKGD